LPFIIRISPHLEFVAFIAIALDRLGHTVNYGIPVPVAASKKTPNKASHTDADKP